LFFSSFGECMIIIPTVGTTVNPTPMIKSDMGLFRTNSIALNIIDRQGLPKFLFVFATILVLGEISNWELQDLFQNTIPIKLDL
jgi:hypothetical protein